MKNCKKISLFICAMLIVATSVMAQTYQQRGVVRMITTSASSPITPVAGVKVAIGNNVSKVTGSNGAFTMSVTKQFNVNGVKPSDTYVLALPTKGKTYYHSQNDLDVVVTTKAQKEADYKKLYAQLKKKYRQQTRELDDMRQECRDRLEELVETDAEYARVKSQLDSLQALYLDYINNEQKLDEEIKKIAEGLSITDYQTLDSIEKRIYELKCAGEWKSITDLIRDVMHGDAATYIEEGKENVAKAEAIRKAAEEQESAAEHDLAARFRFVEECIESFKMQHLNDSVSRYYKILTNADSLNFHYFNDAGMFEETYMANYEQALAYHYKALSLNPIDTLLAASYNNIGKVYQALDNYDKAFENYTKAKDLFIAAVGENHIKAALSNNNLGAIYTYKGEFDKALECFEKAFEISKQFYAGNNNETANSLNNIGSIYYYKEDYTKAIECIEKSNEIHLKIKGEYSPEVAIDYANIGMIYTQMGDYTKALESLEKALSISLAIYDTKHPDVAMTYIDTGFLYSCMNDHVKALELYNKGVDIAIPLLTENHIIVAKAYQFMGESYEATNDYVKALEYLRKALKINEALLSADHPNCLSIKKVIRKIEEAFEK